MEEGDCAMEVGDFRLLDGRESTVPGATGDGIFSNCCVKGLGLKSPYAPS